MQLGTKTSEHLIGRKVIAEYGRCAGCNSRTYYFKKEKLRIRDGKNYCRACWLQVTRGVAVEYKPKIQPICQVCGIGKLYGNRCYTCHPNTPDTKEIKEDRAQVAKENKKEVTNFNDKGTLKKGLLFCQFIKCRKVFDATQAVKIKRLEARFNFCGYDCRDNFEKENTGFIFK